MKTKKFPLFYIFLLLLVAAVLILTEVGKSYLTDVLYEYENAQYKYVAENFLDTHFTAGDGKALAELFSTQISEMEDHERVAAVFDELTEGKTFSLQSVSTGLDETIEYVIKCDDKRFATLRLAKSDSVTEHGFALYTVSDITLSENLFFSRSIWVPEGYTLTVNGNVAAEEYCEGNSIATAFGDLFPGDVLGLSYTTYTIPGLLSEPQFSVTSPLGTEAAVTTLEDGTLCAETVFDTEMPADLQKYVIEATKAYACYLQKDAAFGAVAKYMAPGCPLYENIRTSPNWMVIDHNSYDFADATVSQYHVYNDSAFTCRVSLTHILKYRGLQDYRDYIDITWYLTEIDGKYLIYDSFNNN